MMLHTELCVAKPLCVIFDKVDEYIRKYDRTEFLRFFHSDEKYEIIFDRIRYKKQYYSCLFSYMKIKNDSDDDLLTIPIYF